jgi:hypothetical protein
MFGTPVIEMNKNNSLHYELYGTSARDEEKGIGAELFRGHEKNHYWSALFMARSRTQKNMQKRLSQV